MGHEPQPDPQSPPLLSTDDISFAAFLVCRGYHLGRLDGPPHLVSFVFENVDPAELDRYTYGFALPAVLFATSQKRLYAKVRQRQAEITKLAREAAALSIQAAPKPAEVPA